MSPAPPASARKQEDTTAIPFSMNDDDAIVADENDDKNNNIAADVLAAIDEAVKQHQEEEHLNVTSFLGPVGNDTDFLDVTHVSVMDQTVNTFMAIECKVDEEVEDENNNDIASVIVKDPSCDVAATFVAAANTGPVVVDSVEADSINPSSLVAEAGGENTSVVADTSMMFNTTFEASTTKLSKTRVKVRGLESLMD